MLSQTRAITYRRYKNNQYRYISIFNYKRNENKTHSKKQIQKKHDLNIHPEEAKSISQIMQYIDTVKNNLGFVNAILFEMKDDVNLNKFQHKQLNIALQQTNNILKHHGKNNEKENEAIISFRNKYNPTKYIDIDIKQRQLILHTLTILGLPNRLNAKMYGYKSQYQLYQQILRIILLSDIYKTKQCLENLSKAQLTDITLRLMNKGTISSSRVNIKATMISAIINKIPEYMNNYKYYKKNQQSHQEQQQVLTEFKKEELFINWINIAEQQKGFDKPLFEILFKYFSDANEMNFIIDTFGYHILKALYDKMNEIIITQLLC